MSSRDEVAAELRRSAEAFERAAQHCRIAAQHLTEGNIPRMGAHAFAARGDAVHAMSALDSSARMHADRSPVDAPRGDR